MYASQLASYNDSMEQMGLEYGRGSKIDASYLYDQIKPVTMTNRGGVLVPALAVAGGSYLLGEDQALGSMNNGMKNAYDGMQTIYGNALDNGMNSVIDFFNPKPDMMANGPLSRGKQTSHTMPNGTVMPGASHDNYNYYRNNPHDMTNTELSTMKTEAEMGSRPVQELDTGPFDLAVEDLPLVAKKGPLVRGTYDDYISERNRRARLNSKLEYERMQKGR